MRYLQGAVKPLTGNDIDAATLRQDNGGTFGACAEADRLLRDYFSRGSHDGAVDHEAVCEDMHTTFKIFASLARRPEYSKAFNLTDQKKRLKVSPAEFIMTSVLIYRFKGKLTMSQLSEAILGMRQDIRAQEQDIRMNSRVFKHMLDFIQKLKPSHLKSDSIHDVAAVAVKDLYSEDEVENEVEDDEVDELDEESDTEPSGKGKGKAGKRKRAGKNHDNEEESEWQPTKKTPTSRRTPQKPRLHRHSASLSPYPSSSAPPPYSSQPPSRHTQPDRLDAIRRAKTNETQQQQPMQVEHMYSSQLNGQPWQAVDANGLSLGTLTLPPDRTMMENLGFAQAVSILTSRQPQHYSGAIDPFIRDQQVGPPPSSSRYGGADGGHNRRHAS